MTQVFVKIYSTISALWNLRLLFIVECKESLVDKSSGILKQNYMNMKFCLSFFK